MLDGQRISKHPCSVTGVAHEAHRPISAIVSTHSCLSVLLMANLQCLCLRSAQCHLMKAMPEAESHALQTTHTVQLLSAGVQGAAWVNKCIVWVFVEACANAFEDMT